MSVASDLITKNGNPWRALAVLLATDAEDDFVGPLPAAVVRGVAFVGGFFAVVFFPADVVLLLLLERLVDTIGDGNERVSIE
jgi:hypothetical protein